MPIPKNPFWLPTSKSFSFLLVLPKQIYMIMAMFHKGKRKRKNEKSLGAGREKEGTAFPILLKSKIQINFHFSVYLNTWIGGGLQRKLFSFVILNKHLDSWIASLFLGSSESRIFLWLSLNETRQPFISLANIHKNLWRWDGLNSSLSDFFLSTTWNRVKTDF